MLASQDVQQLCDLFSQLHDNELPALEREQLEQRLLAEREVRRLYLTCMRISAGLSWDLRESLAVANMQEQTQLAGPVHGEPSLEAVPQPPQPVSASPQAVSQSPVLGFLGTAAKFSGTWLSSPKVLALTVVGCLATYFIGLMISIVISRGLWSRHNLAQNVESPAFAAARIISAEGCSWEDPAPRANHAAELSADVSRLIAGSIEIEFDDGARVRIVGPAEFTPQSAGRLELNQGRLTAYVPRRARGFTVGTPTAEVIDLGTEFAMAVEADGQTEVHVVRGLVDVKPSAATGVSQPSSGTRLSAGSAIRVVHGQPMAPIPFDANRFKVPRGVAQESRGLESPAGAIHVVNASFESPAIPLGSFDNDLSDTGWSQSGPAGIFTFAQATDGSQAMFVGSSQLPSSVYQHIGPLLSNTEYTLTVDVVPNTADDSSAGSIGFIALVNGSDDAPAVLAKNASVVQPSRVDGPKAYSVRFATDAAASGELTIVLGHSGSDDPANIQVDYDNVRLTAITLPRPADAAGPEPAAQIKPQDSKPARNAQPPVEGRSRDRRQVSP